MTLSRRTMMLGLSLAGCATAAPDRATALLAQNLRYTPPDAAALGRSVSVVQMITARYRGEAFAFEAYLSVAPDGLTLVNTDPLGRRALTMSWRDGKLTQELAPWVPGFIRPENILADITITYWPEAAVRAGLSGGTLTAEPKRRVIAQDGQDIVTVEYDSAPETSWPALARFRNLAFGYDLDLRSAPSE